jgi:hypothetical protein
MSLDRGVKKRDWTAETNRRIVQRSKKLKHKPIVLKRDRPKGQRDQWGLVILNFSCRIMRGSRKVVCVEPTESHWWAFT